VPEAPTDELADLNGLWPARHLTLVLNEARPSDEMLELLGAFKPGAVVVDPGLVQDPASMAELATVLKRAVGRAGLPLIIAADSGTPNPLAEGPPPAYFSLGAVGDAGTVTEAAAAYGAAARARGFEVVMAPWTSLAAAGQAKPETTWTADPAQSANLVLAYIDGAQSEGVLPIALAFPGMGMAVPGAAGMHNVAEQELRLIASHMVPLREAAAGGVPGIFVTHTSVPVLDKRFPERPATLSPTLIGGIVRGKWNYGGVVVADDLTTLAAALNRPVEELFVEALVAGCDTVLLSNADRTTLRRICSAMLALSGAGGIDTAALDASKKRLDQWQESLAAFAERAKQPAPMQQPERTELLRHTVQTGETLISIARQYSVKVSDLKAWNSLLDSQLSPGQKLNVYLEQRDAPGAEFAPAPDAQQQVLESIAEGTAAPLAEEATPEAPQPEPAEVNEEEKKEEPKRDEPKPEEKKKDKKETESKKAKEEEKPKEEKKEEAPPAEAPAEPAPAPVPAPVPVPVPAPEATAPPVATETPAPAEAAPAAPLVPLEAETPAPEATAPPAEPVSMPTPEPAPAPELKMGKYHVWNEGDSLETVATAHGVTVEQLKDWNLFDVAPPTNGMEVVVVGPKGGEKKSTPAANGAGGSHTVKSGETLHRIAIQHNTTKDELVKINGLERADLIWVGQKLKVPQPAQ
jgi:beta-glucosidase-like glycosyl hydrolase/murein DD-endopeptidase MepM/ murein hydrolase activator NlpD